MSYREIFDVKTPDASYSASFDFSANLAVGETLSTTSTTAAVYSGTDPTPSSIFSGAPTVSGKQVIQTTSGGVEGTVYYLYCSATTSLGKVLSREGYLAIAPGAL